MTQVTVLTGANRRRDWSDEERLEILREAFAPGAKVQHVARRYDISRSLIYEWRRAALRRARAAFVPAVVDDAPDPTLAPCRKRRSCWRWPMGAACGFRRRRHPRWRRPH